MANSQPRITLSGVISAILNKPWSNSACYSGLQSGPTKLCKPSTSFCWRLFNKPSRNPSRPFPQDRHRMLLHNGI